jgi:hypothetical protein
MVELYWALEVCYKTAVTAEFDAFEATRESGLSIEEAFTAYLLIT